MKKTKEQKGITLIALIITIVVLLILAAVAISSITNDGILSYATNAAKEYNQAVANEQEMLNEYINFLNNGALGSGSTGDDGSENEDVTTVAPKVGQYVEYDVSYIDMYSTISYDNSTAGKYGWRYLGTEEGTGKQLIISTGIPMILYWSTSSNDASAKWWDENTNLAANVRVANGLLKNLVNIPYTKVASGTKVSTPNTVIGRFDENNITVENETYMAIGNSFTSNTYVSKVEGVRTLTLAELNRATNNANKGMEGYTEIADNETSSGFFKDLAGDALGLFDMKDLSGYTADYFYWLASPTSIALDSLYYVNQAYGHIHSEMNEYADTLRFAYCSSSII